MKLIPERILIFYDIAQLFIGTDFNDEKLFLALLYSDLYIYLVVEVSPERLRQYLNREIDLRSVYINHETNKSLYTTGNDFELIKLEDSELKEEMLPSEGFYNEEY